MANKTISSVNKQKDSGKKTDLPKEEFEFFYGYQCTFSQFHPAKFEVDDINYNCMEQYMHHQKAVTFHDAKHANEIMSTTDPKKQKKLGRQVENFDKTVWGRKSVAVVRKGSLAKYRQNPKMKEILFATFPKTLVEASPRDRLWGIGMGSKNIKALDRSTWRGKNLLGETLTEVRNKMMLDEGVIKELPINYAKMSSQPDTVSEGQKQSKLKFQKTSQIIEAKNDVVVCKLGGVADKADDKQNTVDKGSVTSVIDKLLPKGKKMVKDEVEKTPTRKRKGCLETAEYSATTKSTDGKITEGAHKSKEQTNLDDKGSPTKKRKVDKSDREKLMTVETHSDKEGMSSNKKKRTEREKSKTVETHLKEEGIPSNKSKEADREKAKAVETHLKKEGIPSNKSKEADREKAKAVETHLKKEGIPSNKSKEDDREKAKAVETHLKKEGIPSNKSKEADREKAKAVETHLKKEGIPSNKSKEADREKSKAVETRLEEEGIPSNKSKEADREKSKAVETRLEEEGIPSNKSKEADREKSKAVETRLEEDTPLNKSEETDREESKAVETRLEEGKPLDKNEETKISKEVDTQSNVGMSSTKRTFEETGSAEFDKNETPLDKGSSSSKKRKTDSF